jgi:hypothetical protein
MEGFSKPPLTLKYADAEDYSDKDFVVVLKEAVEIPADWNINMYSKLKPLGKYALMY